MVNRLTIFSTSSSLGMFLGQIYLTVDFEELICINGAVEMTVCCLYVLFYMEENRSHFN
uniref:Uncharacterized protein n=1 Tax=Rhizophora mucronata TaxID=61149 RepID=A0A2P2QQF4_RHIMU